ncbi:MAG: NUDIX domain-containing protein [Erysipelotrichaceae bacterium]|nr:NUDIX domain-containing protein [Erysipelotrichaceae bacterium]
MKEESCGAIIYTIDNEEYKYLIIKDRHDNYSFPKGHMENGESRIDTAKREIKEEVGLDIDIIDNFEYEYSYKINNDVDKTVCLFLARLNGEPYINDGEAKEILLLSYKDAYKLINFDIIKEALNKANEYLLKRGK